MPLEIAKLKKDEIKKLKQLFENTPSLATYDPFKNGTENEFMWQFFSDTYKTSTYIVATDTEKEEIAGTLSALYFPMRAPDGNVCETIKPEDTLVNIKCLVRYNNRDILKEMFDKMADENKPMNVRFLWGFTYSVNSFERLGFIHKFSSKQGIYVVNPLLAYKHLVKLNSSNGVKQKIQILGLSIISYSKTIILNKNRKGISSKEIDIKEVDETMLLSFLPKNLYSLYLDKYFLDWRIVKNPSELAYSILQFANEKNKIIAYLIYSQINNTVYFIEQFIFDNTLHTNEKNKIINAALQHLKEKKAVIIRAMGFNHNAANKEELDLLSKKGFTFINRGIPFIFKCNDNSVQPEDVYLSRLNTEGTF